MGPIPIPEVIAPPWGAPVDTPVNTTFQTIFVVIHFAVALAVVLIALHRPIKTKDRFELRFRVLVLIGGGLGAFFFEPAGDRLGQLWYNESGGQWPLVHLYGVHVPLWALPVYITFVGGGTLWVIDRVRSGAKAGEFFKVFAGITVADLLIEIPILLWGGLYQYWGDNQPLWNPVWFPLPLWFIIINRLLSLVPALVIFGIMSTRARHIEWVIPFVIPGSLMAAYALAGWPVILTLQNGEGLQVTTLGAFGTIVLATFFTVLGVKILPKLRDVMPVTAAYDGYVKDPVPEVDDDGKRSLADRLAGFV